MENKKEVAIALGYTALMAIGMYVAYHVFGYKYEDKGIVNVLIYFEMIMSIYALTIYLKKYRGSSFKKIEIFPIFIIYSVLIILNAVLFIFHKAYLAYGDTLVTMFITTILIGFSEELIYRGIVLSGLLKNHSKIKAIVYSAILFSLLHAVNIFAAFPLSSVAFQMVNTFIHGVVAAYFAIKLKNIGPLIVYHCLWDLMMLSPVFVAKNVYIVLPVLIFEFVIFIAILWKFGVQKKIA